MEGYLLLGLFDYGVDACDAVLSCYLEATVTRQGGTIEQGVCS